MIYNEINIKPYFGKGKHFKFKRDYGIDVYNDVINRTIILNGTYKDNEKFTARLLFLNKYDGNIKNITTNDKIKRFNGNDFIDTAINSAKQQWENLNKKIDDIKISNLYSLSKTIDLLLVNCTYLNYLGKSKNRTLQKHNLILYKSIMYHTKIFNEFNKNYSKLSHRILFLVGDLDLICDSCSKKNHWTYVDGILKISCGNCITKFPSKKWFMEKYDDKWEYLYDEYFNKIKKMKTNSLEWYLKKYGKEKGEYEYDKRYENQLIRICKLKKNRHSKISQTLFWKIDDNINVSDKIYFHEKNGEYYIRIPKKYNYKSNIIFLDFKCGNKIIEYDGEYWDNSQNDLKRDLILNDLGYDVLRISSDEYNRNKTSNVTINKCVDFILNKNL